HRQPEGAAVHHQIKQRRAAQVGVFNATDLLAPPAESLGQRFLAHACLLSRSAELGPKVRQLSDARTLGLNEPPTAAGHGPMMRIARYRSITGAKARPMVRVQPGSPTVQ